METRIAIVGIIVEEPNSVEALNAVLHEYACFIMGRMGIPCLEKGISVISVVINAPQDTISALSGKIGKIKGVTSKAAYSKI